MRSIILQLIWVSVIPLMSSCGGPTQNLSGPKPVASCKSEISPDTAQYTLYLTPPSSVAEAWLQPESYRPYLRAIARTFVLPDRLLRIRPDSSDASPACPVDSRCGSTQLGEVQFSLNQGRVTSLHWYRHSDAVEVRRAMQAAIWKADSAGLFPGNAPVAGLAPGRVRLGLELSRVPPAIGFPLGVIPIWYIRLTTLSRAISQPQPVYPDSAKQMRLNGSVTLEYAIGVDGTVPRGSIRVIEAQPQLFAQPAIESILASRFEPAKSGKCPIGAWVQQTLRFKVE